MNIIHSLMLSMLLAGGSYGSKIIEWSESRKLSMADFQKVADHSNTSEYSGQTWSGIEPEYNTDGKTIKYKVPALFDRDSSWMVYYDKNHCKDLDVDWMNNHACTYGLAHEQKHFDITEIYARKIRRMFHEEVNRGNLHRIDDMLEAYFREWERAQEHYDNETEHSLDKAQQAKWNAKIQRMLDELSAYKNAEGEVVLSSGRRS